MDSASPESPGPASPASRWSLAAVLDFLSAQGVDVRPPRSATQPAADRVLSQDPAPTAFLHLSTNRHGNWGSIDLWVYSPAHLPQRRPLAERIAHWSGEPQLKIATDAVRAFNQVTGYGNFTG